MSDDNLEQMNVSAIEFGPDVDEFAAAGLTPVPSAMVRPPRIGESKVAFECRLMQTVKLGEMRTLVLGEVLLMHVQDGLVIDRERGWVDTRGLRRVGRTSAGSYVRTNEVIELPTLSPEQWKGRQCRAMTSKAGPAHHVIVDAEGRFHGPPTLQTAMRTNSHVPLGISSRLR